MQPHSPYSAGPDLYAAAARDDGLASTHLAETEDELEFVARGSGPFADLLRRLDKWDDSIEPSGLSPVAALEPHLGRGRWILAHCNYLDDRDIDLLARMPGASVAFCPIASEYFGHTSHRYRDLLAAGVNVCLGTDSVLCQPAAEPQPFGILPQMRRLYLRDGTDPELLLALATTNGLRALGFRPSAATLGAGAPARPIAVRFDPADPRDPLAQILEDGAPAAPVTLD